MTKQVINVGASANDRKGDSLRAAFQKVNANFTELYTALGLDNGGLNLGAFEFTGSTITTTDSTSIVIGQATTITSDLTVSGDVLPSIANRGDLGSLAKPWRSLYVSESTIYFGGVPLSLDTQTNELKVNDIPISQTITYADIPNVPTDISDLTDTTGLLNQGGGAGTGDVTFEGVKVIGAGTASGDGYGYSTLELVPDNNLYDNNQYLVIDPTAPSHIHIRAGGTQDASNAQLFLGGEKNHVSVQDGNGVYLKNEQTSNNTYYYFDPSEFTSGTWFESNGSYYIDFVTTNPALMATILNFGSSDQDTVEVGDGTNSYVLPTAFSYGNLGNDTYRLGVSLEPPGGVAFAFTGMIFTLYTTTYNEASLANSSFDVSVEGDIDMSASGAADLSGNTYVSIRNNSATQPVQIVTNNDDSGETWSFNVDGTLTFPDNTVQTTAFTGIPGPYADDAAAAIAGVAVGNPYYQASGQVFVRLA